MAQIFTQQQTLIVKHPQMPEFKVHCLILEPVEAMELFSSLSQYQKVFAVLHPNTNELIRNDKKELETVTITNIPGEAILNILSKTVEDWEGLEDENKKPIKYEKSKLPYLFKKELSVKNEDGTREPFAVYIQAQLNSKIDLSTPEDSETKKSQKQR